MRAKRKSRRGKRRNPSFSYNRKRRGHRRNPAAVLGKPLGMVKQGFKISTFKTAGLMAAGAFLNMFVRNKIVGFLPSGAAQTYGSYAVGIATGGLMLAIPKVGSQLATGAWTGEAIRGVSAVWPAAGSLGEGLKAGYRPPVLGEGLRRGEVRTMGEGLRVPRGATSVGMR